MLNEFDIFRDFLHQRELRWTPQRKMILDIFYPLMDIFKSSHCLKKFKHRVPLSGSRPYTAP